METMGMPREPEFNQAITPASSGFASKCRYDESAPRKGPSFWYNPATYRYEPQLVSFTDFDKSFLTQIGWDASRVK
jgi:hypothetical protein